MISCKFKMPSNMFLFSASSSWRIIALQSLRWSLLMASIENRTSTPAASDVLNATTVSTRSWIENLAPCCKHRNMFFFSNVGRNCETLDPIFLLLHFLATQFTLTNLVQWTSPRLDSNRHWHLVNVVFMSQLDLHCSHDTWRIPKITKIMQGVRW